MNSGGLDIKNNTNVRYLFFYRIRYHCFIFFVSSTTQCHQGHRAARSRAWASALAPAAPARLWPRCQGRRAARSRAWATALASAAPACRRKTSLGGWPRPGRPRATGGRARPCAVGAGPPCRGWVRPRPDRRGCAAGASARASRASRRRAGAAAQALVRPPQPHHRSRRPCAGWVAVPRAAGAAGAAPSPFGRGRARAASGSRPTTPRSRLRKGCARIGPASPRSSRTHAAGLGPRPCRREPHPCRRVVAAPARAGEVTAVRAGGRALLCPHRDQRRRARAEAGRLLPRSNRGRALWPGGRSRTAMAGTEATAPRECRMAAAGG
jgi:hypothetical protein